MKVWTLLWVCVAGLFLASVAMAGQGKGGQGGSGHEGGKGLGLEKTLSQLNLTDKQQAAVDKLREQLNAKLQEEHGTKYATMSVRREFRDGVMTILAPDQRKKLLELENRRNSGTQKGR